MNRAANTSPFSLRPLRLCAKHFLTRRDAEVAETGELVGQANSAPSRELARLAVNRDQARGLSLADCPPCQGVTVRKGQSLMHPDPNLPQGTLEQRAINVRRTVPLRRGTDTNLH